MIRRIFPHPLLSTALLAMWLLLQQSLGPGHLLLGAALSLFAGQAMAALEPQRPRIRKIGRIIQLFFLVTTDILRSNIAVGRLVLEGRGRMQTSGFLLIPLELRDHTALALLSCIVTATPGSAWLEHDPVRSTVLIHVLDVVDEQDWIDMLKTRYERLLLEIFQ